tara:strand:- start:1040 stop:1201 length:162 start_codon:yes stop_codon:yes gene_type:complete
MEKTKEKKQDISNGEQKKLTKDELIKQTEAEILELVKIYQFKTGYLAGLKELD